MYFNDWPGDLNRNLSNCQRVTNVTPLPAVKQDPWTATTRAPAHWAFRGVSRVPPSRCKADRFPSPTFPPLTAGYTLLRTPFSRGQQPSINYFRASLGFVWLCLKNVYPPPPPFDALKSPSPLILPLKEFAKRKLKPMMFRQTSSGDYILPLNIPLNIDISPINHSEIGLINPIEHGCFVAHLSRFIPTIPIPIGVCIESYSQPAWITGASPTYIMG